MENKNAVLEKLKEDKACVFEGQVQVMFQVPKPLVLLSGFKSSLDKSSQISALWSCLKSLKVGRCQVSIL